MTPGVEVDLDPRRSGKPELPRIDDAIRARIGLLEPASRTLVELVALAGSPLAQDTIARAARLPFDEFSHRASQLRIANLVRTRGTKQLDPIEPIHDRVREAVVGALAPARRVELHAQLARALEGAAQAAPETLAQHWRGAGHAEHTLRYVVQAAEEASQAVAFRRAARLYRMALELGVSTPAQRAVAWEISVLHAAVARRSLGALLGGDEGRALAGEAEAWMTRAGVTDVPGILQMLAPGFAS